MEISEVNLLINIVLPIFCVVLGYWFRSKQDKDKRDDKQNSQLILTQNEIKNNLRHLDEKVIELKANLDKYSSEINKFTKEFYIHQNELKAAWKYIDEHRQKFQKIEQELT